MIIRQATEQDVKEVSKIVDALQVTRTKEGWEKAQSGFFEYPKSEEELLEVLNPYFIVAETGEKIKGFCLSYDNLFFKFRYGNTESLEFRFLLDNVNGSYLYVDQLGVLNPISLGSARIVNALARSDLNLARKKGLDKIIAYACQSPHLNTRSINFLERLGFHKFGEVPIENNIVLAAYELNLNPTSQEWLL